MDPIGIVGLVIAIIQLTGACLKLGRNLVGPSRHTTAALTALIHELYCFNGVVRSLRTQLETNDVDDATPDAMLFLNNSLENCKNALSLIEVRLASTSFRDRFLVGRHFDKELGESLEILRRGRGVFEIILLGDQRVTLTTIERYADGIAEGIRTMQMSIDNGIRNLDYQIEEHVGHALETQATMWNTIQHLDDKLVILRNDIGVRLHHQLPAAWVHWVVMTSMLGMLLIQLWLGTSCGV
ncbi:hypothetical protein F5Y14DRAFT_300337 [Nemania sp. NC0429]|nr:hypothetical protein F5Y14DRAFT_300337 [Nemania sp. NC0429]